MVDAAAEGKRAALRHHQMADLTVDFAGIRCPNPFWLASGPPANCGEQVMRAFDAGWGGAVWKTIGEPIVNVSSRYSSVDWNGGRMMGLNNIELISDRPIDVNLREIAEVKKRYPKHAVIASLMVESKRETWHDMVKRAEDAGADGLELNFGCPHGMSERGMGSAVGQVPEYARMITEWVKEAARTPVLVKLTPNIGDIRTVARAAKRAGPMRSPPSTLSIRSPVSISTRFTPASRCRGQVFAWRLLRSRRKAHRAAHGAADRRRPCKSSSRYRPSAASQGGAKRLNLFCSARVRCKPAPLAMHYGFRIVEDMIDGLSHWMDEKGFANLDAFPRPLAAARHRLAASRSELQNRRAHQSDQPASAASSATPRVGTARTSAFTCRWPCRNDWLDSRATP